MLQTFPLRSAKLCSSDLKTLTGGGGGTLVLLAGRSVLNRVGVTTVSSWPVTQCSERWVALTEDGGEGLVSLTDCRENFTELVALSCFSSSSLWKAMRVGTEVRGFISRAYLAIGLRENIDRERKHTPRDRKR